RLVRLTAWTRSLPVRNVSTRKPKQFQSTNAYFLRVRTLSRRASSKTGRLLRFLLLWFSEVPDSQPPFFRLKMLESRLHMENPSLILAIKKRGDWLKKHPQFSVGFDKTGKQLCILDGNNQWREIDHEPVNTEDHDDYAGAINALLDR